MFCDPIMARFQLTYPAHARVQSGPNGFSLNVDLQLPGRGVTALFGHSGSGKTTLLRCLAGLQRADSGYLHVNGERWQDDKQFVPTHQRSLGYVFQEASLFAHLSARGNLDYAFRRAGPAAVAERYRQAVSLMGIEGILDQHPDQLSGGERQRVAIARALLIHPRLLLMDEPLAALDMARKQEILPYLERMREDLDIPIIYVTHSADEVARLADHLVVLDQGQVVAQGALTEVLSRLNLPIRLGDDTGVVAKARIVERDMRWHLVRAEFPGGSLWVRDNGDAIGARVRIRIMARDVSLALTPHDDTSILNRLQAQVVDVAPDTDDAMALVQLKVGEQLLLARITWRSVEHLGVGKGQPVWAQIKSVAIVR